MESLAPELCDEHASEASFLWEQRDAAVHDHAFDAGLLAALDERLEAHVDGMRLGGEVGLDACLSALEDEPGAGPAFSASLLAVDRWDLPAFARVIDLAAGGAGARGIVSALGWAPPERLRALLPGLLSDDCPPALQRIGIASCAVHREDPGAALANALYATDEHLMTRALKAAGELGRADVLPSLRASSAAAGAAPRFWSAWSRALLADPGAAEDLWAIASGGGAFAERGAALAMRRTDPRPGASRLLALADVDGGARAALAGVAALGDPALVPWLLERMKTPTEARRAGFAFHMITGLDLAAARLASVAPEGFSAGPSDDPTDDDVRMDPDESLPWPDVTGVEAWWSREGARFPKGTRLFLGAPLTAAWLGQVLDSGRQPAREAAAIELVLAGHRRRLPEVRAAFGRAAG